MAHQVDGVPHLQLEVDVLHDDEGEQPKLRQLRKDWVVLVVGLVKEPCHKPIECLCRVYMCGILLIDVDDFRILDFAIVKSSARQRRACR